MSKVKVRSLFLIFCTVFTIAHGSSCPCNEAVDVNIKTIENLVVYLNRAILRFKPGNFDRFFKFLENYKIVLTQIADAPKFALEGTFAATKGFNDFIKTLINAIDSFQSSFESGADPVAVLQAYFETNRQYFISTQFLILIEPSTDPAVQELNEASLDFLTAQVNLLEETLSNLIDTTDEALLNYLKEYKTNLIILLNGIRASCPGCLVPCCKN